ncbi:Lsr2 protein [Rhodococcus sp. AG1013]|jgi:nucleoid-associated protein Lsr2|nr:Lsr2 protein [Rhodococcus sp. AG1013]
MYQVVVEILDDFDGEKIGSGGETIDFSVNGIEYSIDLRDESAAQLRRLFGSYIRHARRVGGHKRWTGMIAASDNGMRDVREWARAHDYPISGTSRVPHAVLADYAAAHPAQTV